MKLYVFTPSSRVLGLLALKTHLGIECEMAEIDLGSGDQCIKNVQGAFRALQRQVQLGTRTPDDPLRHRGRRRDTVSILLQQRRGQGSVSLCMACRGQRRRRDTTPEQRASLPRKLQGLFEAA